ncbi:hypothetical protein NX059_009181 [Plenodomus lindquistii]|nr:hypothetical protein NX059_009181 [Plenodomus lindquistii]
MDQLRISLQDLRISAGKDGTVNSLAFVPEPALFELLTQDTVTAALEDNAFLLEAHQRLPTAKEVVRCSRKLFSILVELRMEYQLKQCLEKQMSDSNLPIKNEAQLRDEFPECATQFNKLQWEYFPVHLREHFHIEMSTNQIVPYLKNEKISSGGFSKVFKIRFHPSYQNWSVGSTGHQVDFVRKEISTETSNEGQRRESDLLFLLRSLENDNIVRLITSYTQNGFCNLVFPVADRDLHDLLLDPDRPTWCTEPTLAFDSLRGLVNGLHYLHNFSPRAKTAEDTERVTRHGYHHDIKPRNVLVQGSRLILADFGLANMKDVHEDTKTEAKPHPPTYGAPEARDGVSLKSRSIGRAYDMWSIGCVIGELATYCLGGAISVKSFRSGRGQQGLWGRHNCFHHEGDVNPAVIDWYHNLEVQHHGATMVSLLALSESTLIVNPEDRPPSQFLVQELNKLSLQGWLGDILSATLLKADATAAGQLSPVYQFKLMVERNRMHAWGYTHGLKSFNQQTLPWSNQENANYEKMRDLLCTCATRIADVGLSHMAESDDQQRVLDIMTLTNDALILNITPIKKATIDNTFMLLAMSSREASQRVERLVLDAGVLQSFEGKEDRAPQILPDKSSSIARLASLAISSADSLVSQGQVKMIEHALVSETVHRAAFISPLELRWYYQGFREHDRRKVLVEERSYEGPWSAAVDEEDFIATGQEVLQRVMELAQLFGMKYKPKAMRLLNLLGVYHLPTLRRFGFVYDKPDDHEDSEPVSLSTVIRETKDSEKHPTLNTKFLLANTIAACIHTLHLTGWIHKAICSTNLVFMTKPYPNLTKAASGQLYLAGFQHSRQFSKGAYSDGSFSNQNKAFIHPTYIAGGERFHPAFDYYALGIVLLELALWRPIDKMFKASTPPVELHNLLCQNTRTYVPQRMGTGYSEVIIACLKFYENYKQVDEHTNIILLFQQEIMEKLKQCSLV